MEEGAFHHGDDPIEEDKAAQEKFEQYVNEYQHTEGDLRIVSILGEEAIKEVPRLQPNERLIVLDPLDGSKTWAACRTNFCVALLALNADDTGLPSLEIAMITTPLHVFTFFPPNQLFIGALGQTSDNDTLLSSVVPEAAGQLYAPANTPFLALNAYKTREREALVAIADALPGWHIITTAGNPATPYVVAGGLTAALTLRAQTNWDAVGVLMAASTDAVVRQANDGAIVKGPGFSERFNQVLIDGNAYVVPPMIVAKSRERSDEIYEAVKKSKIFESEPSLL
ncbi:MAG: hypothetical protein LBE83_06315 [Propionibacteriaceae bacterium]|jgi:fructose-1,6-bisphosphatase/inositol monophosphatase family enzyme|nr:hypothetical protein [Propionibacteriaceae bacterium]